MGSGCVGPKTKERKIVLVRLVCNWIRGPKGVGGPHDVSRLSCQSPKILVSVLGKFRRFGEYINSIRYLDDTYSFKYKRVI